MRSSRQFVAAGAFGLLIGAGHAFAQTPAPPAPQVQEDVFVSATVSDVPATSVPRSVTVITRGYLEQIGITSIVEGLRLAPGVDPRARGPRDVQTDFSIRGSTFGQNLILVDGVRLNDSQSGHHNGEIPISLEGIDRVEVVYGPSSAVHGADALGGTINVITRRGHYASLRAEFGQHNFSSVQGSMSGNGLPENWALDGWGSRSDGFVPGREFAMGGVGLRGSPTPNLTVGLRHQRRAFGAAGFYGNAPSQEWTDGTIGDVSWQRATGNWTTALRGSFRDHRDHFIFNRENPSLSENRHHTNGAEVTATATRELAGRRRLTGGVSAGRDWITSTNLKDHDYTRTSLFGELLLPIASRATLQAGLRADNYSNFGRSVSPSFSFVASATNEFRVRASTGRAFRIPTFTELYYTDPNNQGSADLKAEHGWFVDGGADWIHEGWAISVTPFRRWDKDVIDWLRPDTTVKWQTTNVRDVTSTGFEASITRRWSGALLRLHYAGLALDAPAIDQLSKYVLEYARHQSGGSLSVPLPRRFRVAVNVDHRHRVDGQEYDLVGLRISRAFTRGDIYIDGANLLDEQYHEVVGVAMPGRWITVGVTVK